MNIVTVVRSWPLWGKIAAVVGIIFLGALAWDWLAPYRPVVTTDTHEHTLTQKTEDTQAVKDLKTELEQQKQTNAAFQSQVVATLQQQAQTNTNTHEVAYRGDLSAVAALLAQQKTGQPVIVNIPAGRESSVVPVAGGAQSPVPVEVIIRDQTSMAKVDTQGTSSSTTKASMDTTDKTNSTAVAHETTNTHSTEKVESDKTTKTTTGGDNGSGGNRTAGGDSDSPRLGIGLQAGSKGGAGIALNYDLIQLHGPKLFGLRKFFVAGGVGVEKHGWNTDFTTKSLDVTPYGALGYKRISLDFGYRVFAHEPVIGLNYRFAIK